MLNSFSPSNFFQISQTVTISEGAMVCFQKSEKRGSDLTELQRSQCEQGQSDEEGHREDHCHHHTPGHEGQQQVRNRKYSNTNLNAKTQSKCKNHCTSTYPKTLVSATQHSFILLHYSPQKRDPNTERVDDLPDFSATVTHHLLC